MDGVAIVVPPECQDWLSIVQFISGQQWRLLEENWSCPRVAVMSPHQSNLLGHIPGLKILISIGEK